MECAHEPEPFITMESIDSSYVFVFCVLGDMMRILCIHMLLFVCVHGVVFFFFGAFF